MRKTLQRKIKPKSGTSPRPEGEGLVDLQPETEGPEGEPVEAATAPLPAPDAGPVSESGASAQAPPAEREPDLVSSPDEGSDLADVPGTSGG